MPGMRVTALCGGVGGAKLVLGLHSILRPGELTVIGNTGDDIELFGLHISPDLDIVMYTLAGLVDQVKGWGIRDDTFAFLETASSVYGQERWFNIGDRDLATHVLRTQLLREKLSLTRVTATLCDLLGLSTRILPMSDDPVQTHVRIADGSLIHFEEYFVKRGCQDDVCGVEYVGSESAVVPPAVLGAIEDADVIVVCPSNPVASIGPILSVRGVRQALEKSTVPIVGVSPLVGGRAVKGPTEKFMKGLGMPVSPAAVADYYGFLSHYVIDRLDAGLKHTLEERGLHVTVTDTVMTTLESKKSLAETVILESLGRAAHL
ncbi:MAG: 2-phospho-L-lactate transferase [Candidatus Thorarchaeota archaeon]|nr:2-phospho-L-lactate transferase [Candidatus Thorarchaeota archaeon]